MTRRERLREWWVGVTFGTPHPVRRLVMLVILGTAGGIAEASVVILLVALASGSEARNLPLVDGLPTDTWALAGFTLGAVAVFAVSQGLSARLGARAGAETQAAVRTQLLDAYFATSWPVQEAERSGAIQELVMSNATAVGMGTQQVVSMIVAILNIGVVVVAAIAVSAWATFGLVAIAALTILILEPFRRWTLRMAGESAQVGSELALDTTESAQLARELRVFGVAGAARARLGERISASSRLFEAVRFGSVAAPPLSRSATIVILTLGVAVVASRGDVSLPLVGATVLLMLRALGHSQQISAAGQSRAERWANLQRVLRHLKAWREAAPEETGTRPLERIGRLELRSVSFTYPTGERPALLDADIDVIPGEQLAVVGRSGAGKTTLAGVILGLLRPQAGRVLVDGVPLSELDPAAWHSRIALVPQEPRLLTGTVVENIRFLRDGLDDATVRRAALDAGLGPELESWPEGLERDCGPAGGALSGGQRQRIALARALAGDPDLLVLDEPTSALDVHTEAAVRDAVAGLRGRTTVVIVAHRLSTLEASDRVVVVESGLIGAVGPAVELAGTDGYYRDALAVSGLRP